MIRKPKVGDILYLVPVGNRAWSDGKFGNYPVTKVGLKYFYVCKEPFEIESFKNGHWMDKNNGIGIGHNWYVYLSKEIYDRISLKEQQRHKSRFTS